MSIEYYKIPESDLSMFHLKVGNELIEPTQLYDGSWIISSKALDLQFVPKETIDKTKSYDYWTSIDPRWFKSTYDYIQSLEIEDNFEDGTTAEYIEQLKSSIPPISVPNSRSVVVQWVWNPMMRLWNSLFG